MLIWNDTTWNICATMKPEQTLSVAKGCRTDVWQRTVLSVEAILGSLANAASLQSGKLCGVFL